jgi:alpha-L-fucosidase
MQERLLQIGDWLSVNGEGIYGSSRWKVAQEGQIDNTTVRYTQSKDGSVIFAFVLDWPEDNRVTLRAVNRSSGNASVTLLGWTASRLVWSKLSGGGGILVSLPYVTPSTLPCMYVWTLKLLGFSG